MTKTITGPIPSSVGLSQLQEANFINNNLSSFPPDFFTGLSSLCRIYLDYNPFEPWEIPESIKEATTLITFSANKANIKGRFPGELSVGLASSGTRSLWVNEQCLNGTIEVIQTTSSSQEKQGFHQHFDWDVIVSVTGEASEKPEEENTWKKGVESLTFSAMFLCFVFNFNIIFATTDFDFGTLTLSSLKLLGDAHLNIGSVRLTRDLQVPDSSSGRALYSKPVRFRQPGTHKPTSFSTFFSFSITNLNPSSIGGGLAFVISPEEDFVGAGGGFLELLDDKGRSSGFVAVEFDTFMDVEFRDINGNHVGLDLNIVISSQVGDLDIDLKSGNAINSWIEYEASFGVFEISVSYSNLKPKNPIISVRLDLDQYVNDFMYVGFSGSTQGSTEIHSIEWWSFSSYFPSNSGSGSRSTSFPPPPTEATLTNPTTNSVKSPPSPPPPPSSSCHNQLCKEGPGAVAGVVTAGAFFLALFAGGLIWAYSKKLKDVKKLDHSIASEMIKTPKQFTYKELMAATRCFNANRIIGHGAFGTVYKGILPDNGDIVAVKRCSHNRQGKNEFLSELLIIGTLRHRNPVRLQGWCQEKGEILLVYDLMPNGSLYKALFEAKTPLPWPHRQKILVGVASALAYLHQECDHQVIHRDVKTSNIMLDEAFNAKLGDFGLARQVEHDKSPDATVAAGTMGYGAVALEVAGGRRPIEGDGNAAGKDISSGNLVEWIWSLHREGRLLDAADARLEGEFDEAEMRRALLVGLACSHPEPASRPTMRSVVQMLVGEAVVPVVPRTKPSTSFSTSQLLLNLQDSVSDWHCDGNVTISGSSSDNSHIGVNVA
ncbi:L-type lectin-domain containing receptor kinase VIII.1 [Hibiscus syriacus]|uniref:non-specific serine/threonine protein kinase n=1 Tax=Hibiscus syriacus TaxID=106335 RepID=A0A6A2ZFV4_HIBSY|nr:L-type lectin-domain containing receptor kinase VIII.1 [Hibiscus syriacus]